MLVEKIVEEGIDLFVMAELGFVSRTLHDGELASGQADQLFAPRRRHDLIVASVDGEHRSRHCGCQTPRLFLVQAGGLQCREDDVGSRLETHRDPETNRLFGARLTEALAGKELENPLQSCCQ